MAECKAYHCTNNKRNNKGLHFHQVPKPPSDPKKNREKMEITKKWLHNLGMGHRMKTFPFGRNSVVCEKHFTPDCFKVDLRAKFMGTKPRQYLVEGAVPTLFKHRPPPVGEDREEQLETRRNKKIYEGLEAEITMNVLKIKAEPSSDEEHSSLLDIELPNKKEIIETLPELRGEGNSLKEEFPQSIIEFEEVKTEKEEEYDETDKTEVAVSPEAVIMKKEKIEPTEDLQQLDCDSAVEFDVSSYTNRKASCGCEEDRETETSGNMCKSLYRFDVCRESNNQNEHLIKHERKLSEDILAYGSNSKESSWSRKTKGKFDVCQETAVYKNFEENQKTQSEHQINNYKASAKSCMYNTEFQTDETIQKEKMYSSCGVCGKIFATRYKLKQHQSSHNGMKPYTCSVCGKGFTARQNLKQHQWRHTGVKPYTCRVCSKDLTTKKNLKQHQWIHTGEKLYSCDICGKEFAQGSSLKRHQITHTGEKPFSCVVCGKTFGREKYLEEHEVIHTGEKPYSCDVCGKEFTRSSSLKIHQVSHSGKKPYSCSVCGKDFTRKFSLKRHEKIHNGKKLYCCNVCGKEFAQSSSVEKHQIMHSDKNMLCVKKSLEG